MDSTLPAASPRLATVLAQNGSALLELRAWTEAELLLGECVGIRDKTEPDVLDVRGEKKIAFKMKRRKGYHKTIGHRQELTVVKIKAIKA